MKRSANYNAAELAEITAIQEQRSITRKSAIRVFAKDGYRINLTNANKKAAPVAKPQANPMPITVAANAAPAVTALPDVKSRQANDDSAPAGLAQEVIRNSKPEVVAGLQAAAAANDKQPEAPATPKPVVPQTAAGAARGEGIRLYKLSNVATLAKDEDTTTKALFQHVYGPKGHSMTWEQRAKVVGLATAEEAAKQFARMRGEKAGSCIVAKEEPKAKSTEKK